MARGSVSGTVRVPGLRRLRADLKRAVGNLDDLKTAYAAAAAFVAGASRTRAPRRTGRLAGKVKGNRAAGRASISVPGVVYAGPVHWGWPAHGIDPQTFIVDAAQATEAQWLPAFEADVNKALEPIQGRRY